jgi:hypothetical protein
MLACVHILTDVAIIQSSECSVLVLQVVALLLQLHA